MEVFERPADTYTSPSSIGAPAMNFLAGRTDRERHRGPPERRPGDPTRFRQTRRPWTGTKSDNRNPSGTCQPVSSPSSGRARVGQASGGRTAGRKTRGRTSVGRPTDGQAHRNRRRPAPAVRYGWPIPDTVRGPCRTARLGNAHSRAPRRSPRTGDGGARARPRPDRRAPRAQADARATAPVRPRHRPSGARHLASPGPVPDWKSRRPRLEATRRGG